MVEYTTRDTFLRFRREVDLQEQVNIQKRAEERSPQGATFLSHSSKDEELVVGAIRVLEGHGASVYVDKKDPELPPYTNTETASTLRSRIGQTKKFVLLASKNSKESKWVPWELGLADGYKGHERIALFPAVDSVNETAWTSWEYLGLYKRIVWGKLEGYAKEVWMVWDHRTNKATALSKWLQG